MNDKAKGVVIVVMQRLHIDDLTGHLLKQEGWELLNLPAIAMEDERYPNLYGDRIVRRKGEELHPGIEDREQLRQMMLGIGAKTFMAQYQQDPYPPGKGNGYRGFVNVINPQRTKQSSAFIHKPEEDFVLNEVFGEPTGFSDEPPLINSLEDWLAVHGGKKLEITENST